MSFKRSLDRMLYYSRQDNRVRKQRLRSAPPQERRLWREVLRNYPVLFLRKYALIPRRNLPVDFYAPDLRMVIEVVNDAESRGELSLHDRNNRTFISNMGNCVLYISESEIDGDIELVRGFIDREVRERTEQLAREKAAVGGEEPRKNQKTDPGTGG